MPAGDRVAAEAARLVGAADAAGVPLRVMGGVAVALHGAPPELRREYEDIDLVTARKGGGAAARLLVEEGYEPNERFNAMQGDRRLVFHGPYGRVDVFVGEFRMCHAIPLADRLALDGPTLPLAELLATKLQIVELNAKDAGDVAAMLAVHEVADHDDDAINAKWLARLLASDWGLYTTALRTLDAVSERVASTALDGAAQNLVRERAAVLAAAAEAAPKSLRWRSRARVGTRVKWYDEPEEIAHGPG